jgi:hypothetical protein
MTEMVEVIRGEERLMWISDAAVAGGNVRKHEISRHISDLQKARRRPQQKQAVATVGELRAMGIRVVKHG